MHARHSLAAALLFVVIPALAAGQPVVWISSLNDIRQVTTTGATTGASRSIHLSSGTAVGHLALGPDGRLYFGEHFATESCISRVNPSASVNRSGANVTYERVLCSTQLVNEPRELRFDAAGALLMATASRGVLRIAACALSAPATCAATAVQVVAAGTGSGLDHAPDGAVLYSDGNAIRRSPTAPGFPLAALNPIAIDVVTGGIGSVLPSLPTGAVCVSEDSAITCHDVKTSTPVTLHTFPAIDKTQGWAFAKDDSAWIATSVDTTRTLSAGQAPHNGLLWRVTGSGASIVYPTRFTGQQPPIVGIAMPPTSKTATETTPTTTHGFVFGSDVLTIETPLACRLRVAALERSPAEVQPCFDSTGLSLAPGTYLGESLPTEYDVTVVAGSCFATGELSSQRITAFFPAGENLAGVRRPSGAPSASNACVSNTFEVHELAAPNDAAVGQRGDSFSGFMGAVVRQAASVATVRLLSPLQNAPIVTTHPTPDQVDAAAEQNRGNVAVKFSLSRNGTAVTTTEAVLSVQRLGALDASGQLVLDSTLCAVQPQDAVTGPPKFFTAENIHRFNLDTSAMSPVVCTQPGLYAFGISFPVDGIADPVTFLVELK